MLIYARWISPEEYGGFVLLQVLISLGLVFGEFGIDTAVTKFIASTEKKTEHSIIVNTGLYFRAFSIVLISLLIFLFQDAVYTLLEGNVPERLLAYLPVMLLVEGFLSFYSSVLAGMIKFKELAIVNLIYSSTSFILTAILVIPLNMGVDGLVWARLIPSLLSLVYASAITQIKLSPQFDWACYKKMFKFGIPLYGNSLLGFAYSRANTFVIGYVFGPAEIAIFEFARRIPESLEMVYNSFKDVYFPYIVGFYANGAKDRVANMINQTNRLTCLLGGLGVLAAFGFAEWFFRLAFSEQYLASIPSFDVLMLVLIFTALDSNLGYSLTAIGDSDKPLFINIFRFSAVFALYFAFIPYFNIVGIALAALIGLVLVNPVNVFFLHRRKIGVDMAFYLKPIFLMAVSSLPLLLITNRLIATLLALPIFVAGNFLMKTLQREDFIIAQQQAKSLLSRLKQRAG